jgi:hypothetical protein
MEAISTSVASIAGEAGAVSSSGKGAEHVIGQHKNCCTGDQRFVRHCLCVVSCQCATMMQLLDAAAI